MICSFGAFWLLTTFVGGGGGGLGCCCCWRAGKCGKFMAMAPLLPPPVSLFLVGDDGDDGGDGVTCTTEGGGACDPGMVNTSPNLGACGNSSLTKLV